MLKHTITYTDFNDVEVTEDFYFNLTKTECTEMNMTTPGGYVELLDRIVKAKDPVQIYKEFKTFVLASYGEKSADGRRFMKSPEIATAFSETMAYDELMTQLTTDDKFAAAFVQSVLPKAEKKKLN